MKILFVHQNFPGQFKFLAPALVARGHEVRALHMRANAPESYAGVVMHHYKNSRGSTPNIHPWLQDFETKVIRGEACYEAARDLAAKGFTPDVIIAHHGWGESMLLKHVWPDTRLGLFCEFYYKAEGADVGFDPEFPNDIAAARNSVLFKNLNNTLHLQLADGGLSPTTWQASTFPEDFRSKICVIHDGIDTNDLVPDESVRLELPDGRVFTRGDKIITFVNRHIEPYRGCHIFFRSLPAVLAAEPDANVLVIGSEGVSYGQRPPGDKTWKQIFWDEEVAPKLSESQRSRVHFLGRTEYADFKRILTLSAVHVYLTYPFVLSWSLLEAMSTGCAVVASDTQPLQEVITHDKNGRLFSFFSPDQLACEILSLLSAPEARERLGREARQFVVANYDLSKVCLPKQISWVEALAKHD